jgi:predicted  nucleic acid-binding Zn-ribbon protein
MDVKEQIEILVALQKNDTDVERVQGMISGIREKRSGLEARVAEAASAAETAAAELAELRKEYRALEGDVKINLELIRKSKSRLPSVKSNKEYQALLRQIEETERTNSRIEDSMLSLLDRIEAGEKLVAQREQEGKQAEAAFASEKARLDGEVRNGKAQLTKLAAERERIAGSASDALLETFNRTRQLVEGPAVVPVRGTTCEGCNINIPPQQAIELRRFESLNFCPFCNRLIYWERPQE